MKSIISALQSRASKPSDAPQQDAAKKAPQAPDRTEARLGVLAGLPARRNGASRSAAKYPCMPTETKKMDASSAAKTQAQGMPASEKTLDDIHSEALAKSIILGAQSARKKSEFIALIKQTYKLPLALHRECLVALGTRIPYLMPTSEQRVVKGLFELEVKHYADRDMEGRRERLDGLNKEVNAVVEKEWMKSAPHRGIGKGMRDLPTIIRLFRVSDPEEIVELESTLITYFKGDLEREINGGAKVPQLAANWGVKSHENIEKLERLAAERWTPAYKKVFEGADAEKVARKYGIHSLDNINLLRNASSEIGAAPVHEKLKLGERLADIFKLRHTRGDEVIVGPNKADARLSHYTPDQLAAYYRSQEENVIEDEQGRLHAYLDPEKNALRQIYDGCDLREVVEFFGITNPEAIVKLEDAILARYSFELSKAIDDGANVATLAEKWNIRSAGHIEMLEAEAVSDPKPAYKEMFAGANAQDVAEKYGIRSHGNIVALEKASFEHEGAAALQDFVKGKKIPEIEELHGIRSSEAVTSLREKIFDNLVFGPEEEAMEESGFDPTEEARVFEEAYARSEFDMLWDLMAREGEAGEAPQAQHVRPLTPVPHATATKVDSAMGDSAPLPIKPERNAEAQAAFEKERAMLNDANGQLQKDIHDDMNVREILKKHDIHDPEIIGQIERLATAPGTAAVMAAQAGGDVEKVAAEFGILGTENILRLRGYVT